MKLKEKLAVDHWIKNTDQCYSFKDMHPSYYVIEGHKYGFDEAKKLISSVIYSEILLKNNELAVHLLNLIDKLGEEETK